jgi:thiol:disulfide interchange protein DsbD
MRVCLFLFFIVFLSSVASAQNNTQTITTPHTKASLIVATSTVTANQKVDIALHLELKAGWHTYWQNAGDSGLPATITWVLPEGVTASPLMFPTPKLIPTPPLVTYGYDAPVTLLSTLTLPKNLTSDSIAIKATATWLVCKDICIPETATFTLSIPVSSVAPVASPETEALFNAARTAFATPLNAPLSYQETEKNLAFRVPQSVLPAAQTGTLFSTQEGIVENVITQSFTQQGEDYLFTFPLISSAENKTLSGIITLQTTTEKRAFAFTAAPSTTAPLPSSPTLSFWLATAFAFIGGLILNLMPCVFPVLALKAISLSKLQDKDAFHARQEGWAYTGGILTAFLIFGGVVLSLQHTANAVGWGFQLQAPAFVMALAFIFIALGLSLSGVLSLPTLLGNTGGKISQQSSFFLGMIAAVVATPCTAPFMAAALGYALVKPPLEAFSVIIALGLGLATPYLLITHSAWLRRKMPRSGAWMERLKHWLALPMYATAVWLLYVLQQQQVEALLKALIGITLLVVTAFVVYRNKSLAKLSYCGLALLLALLIFTTPQPQPTTTKTFSPSDIATYTAKQPVFVDVTAAWCITCKVNERVTLKNERVQAAFKENNVQLIVLDWTNRDTAIGKYLEQFGRSGVPLYVYYPLGKEPVVLPQLLTPNEVIKTVSP